MRCLREHILVEASAAVANEAIRALALRTHLEIVQDAANSIIPDAQEKVVLWHQREPSHCQAVKVTPFSDQHDLGIR